ncbi:MAG: DUF2135 domain-containing protein [Kiritimatiellae bacterium]|nr:DUF2135 domain-containing protein [Kiritimatiellia bacterium]
MKTTAFAAFAACALAVCAQSQESVPSPRVPAPEPPAEPVFRPKSLLKEEKPVIVETAREIAEENALFRRVSTTITFTNPNGRVFEGELDFPLPSGATVCGYALEVNGTMVPGVVCGKEEARTAFENEKRKGVDPGIVEKVGSATWRTRIYPLMPNVPRKAKVDFIEPLASAPDGTVVVERSGEEVFVGEARPRTTATRADRLRAAGKATLWWDASMSRNGKASADRNLLECMPEKGDFTLVVFRNVIEAPLRFETRAALLSAVDALAYDGGTCLDKVERAMAESKDAGEKFLFTDELDVEAAAGRRIFVRKLAKDEKPPAEPKEGGLLAVAWAADYIADHAADASARKAEFLELGRKCGVASPVTSLIVLETLDQYLNYKIEPPASMSFHDEWKKRRAAEDDPIAAAKRKSDHMNSLLGYWEERVKWWNDPIPTKKTPKSGLFDGLASAFGLNGRRRGEGNASVPRSAAVADDVADEEAMEESVATSGALHEVGAERLARAPMAAKTAGRSASSGSSQAAATAATIKIAAWDPKTPYLKAIDGAKDAYAEYLVQRDAHGSAPAFYLDCAGRFFKKGEMVLAVRMISNLSEMRLEDAGLWRTMGWRLREAGAYEEAIEAFRRVLAMRGEEPQSKRDLALVLTEYGKMRKDAAMLVEAMKLLHSAAFEPTARRSGRRGNDMQTSVIALEELNGLLSWVAANGVKAEPPAMDEAYRRDMPLDLRIMMSWDVDETDVDLHVLEPDGEEAYYSHRRTSSGGFVSEDVTTGYGPEEYLRKKADKGVYRILANYYASHRQALTGAATVTATVYTGWGTAEEKREILSFRLDRPKDKHPVGEVKIGE